MSLPVALFELFYWFSDLLCIYQHHFFHVSVRFDEFSDLWSRYRQQVQVPTAIFTRYLCQSDRAFRYRNYGNYEGVGLAPGDGRYGYPRGARIAAMIYFYLWVGHSSGDTGMTTAVLCPKDLHTY